MATSDSVHGKLKVVLVITGSIAAYKSAEIIRLLVTSNCDVRVVMSASAEKFIGIETLEALSGNTVTKSFWNENHGGRIGHIELSDWADVVLIAPATADFIAKMASGFTDSPGLAIALATRAPILLAPAMNVRMLSHSQTQLNLDHLQTRGVQIIESQEGFLACGWIGAGRLADPKVIASYVRRAGSNQDLKGKHILITAGATREAIDPVRFLSNRSSGKMGVQLAEEAFRRGAKVTLIHGPLAADVDSELLSGEVPEVKIIAINSALDLQSEVKKNIANTALLPDVVIMAAAVADYRVKDQAKEKIKRSGEGITLELVPNPDILAELGTTFSGSRAKPLLIGFALETGTKRDLIKKLEKKITDKKTDYLVGNLANDSLDKDTNSIVILKKKKTIAVEVVGTKKEVANRILDMISSTETP